jgi:2-polyprenyl-3-methyl-5-hydroxy-6-metoxy-1,4-benzoquinol methylase
MRPGTKDLIDAYECVYKKWPDYGGVSRGHTLLANRVEKYKTRGVASAFEISCGKGILLREMKMRRIPTVASEPCLSVLSASLKEFSVYPYMVHELDAIPDGAYDLVYSVNVVDHLMDKKDAIKALIESARIAAVGFAFVVNGDRFMKRIDEPLSWWTDVVVKLCRKEVLYTSDALGGGDLIEAWF